MRKWDLPSERASRDIDAELNIFSCSTTGYWQEEYHLIDPYTTGEFYILLLPVPANFNFFLLEKVPFDEESETCRKKLVRD